MPVITRKLLRKRAEHNEGMISTLEEISLHQEELEGINEVLGATCRKLKILYLQNNIIPKMENLFHLKDLEYLNLALNNITKIEGLQNCEFLNKLDLTVNFIDMDTLEDSIQHLLSRDRLKDLYMMGNPCQANWEGFTMYVVAKLPQLETLDGTAINRSSRILALQRLENLEIELRELAAIKRQEKEMKRIELNYVSSSETAIPASESEEVVHGSTSNAHDNAVDDDCVEEVYSNAVLSQQQQEKVSGTKLRSKASKINYTTTLMTTTDTPPVPTPFKQLDDSDGNEKEELTEHNPETRIEIYRELAEQKREKEEREAANRPRERDYEAEHKSSVESIRKTEEALKGDSKAKADRVSAEDIEVKQKNEGQWNFRWDEESKAGCLCLEVDVSRHLDSSLIDVDVHPSYVSIIIKGKLLRLRLPSEVSASESKCQRSKTTGSLLVIMPRTKSDKGNKYNPIYVTATKSVPGGRKVTNAGSGNARVSSTSTSIAARPKKLSLQEELLAASGPAGAIGSSGESLSTGNTKSSSVDIRNIIRRKTNESGENVAGSLLTLASISSDGALGEIAPTSLIKEVI